MSGVAPPPPKRPTIIRQGTGDGGKSTPRVPARKAPPVPGMPRANSESTVPPAISPRPTSMMASSQVIDLNDTKTSTVPVASPRPPTKSQETPSGEAVVMRKKPGKPSRPMSMSVAKSSETVKKRPEITVVAARPMSEVGFRGASTGAPAKVENAQREPEIKQNIPGATLPPVPRRTDLPSTSQKPSIPKQPPLRPSTVPNQNMTATGPESSLLIDIGTPNETSSSSTVPVTLLIPSVADSNVNQLSDVQVERITLPQKPSERPIPPKPVQRPIPSQRMSSVIPDEKTTSSQQENVVPVSPKPASRVPPALPPPKVSSRTNQFTVNDVSEHDASSDNTEKVQKPPSRPGPPPQRPVSVQRPNSPLNLVKQQEGEIRSTESEQVSKPPERPVIPPPRKISESGLKSPPEKPARLPIDPSSETISNEDQHQSYEDENKKSPVPSPRLTLVTDNLADVTDNSTTSPVYAEVVKPSPVKPTIIRPPSIKCSSKADNSDKTASDCGEIVNVNDKEDGVEINSDDSEKILPQLPERNYDRTQFRSDIEMVKNDVDNVSEDQVIENSKPTVKLKPTIVGRPKSFSLQETLSRFEPTSQKESKAHAYLPSPAPKPKPKPSIAAKPRSSSTPTDYNKPGVQEQKSEISFLSSEKINKPKPERPTVIRPSGKRKLSMQKEEIKQVPKEIGQGQKEIEHGQKESKENISKLAVEKSSSLDKTIELNKCENKEYEESERLSSVVHSTDNAPTNDKYSEEKNKSKSERPTIIRPPPIKPKSNSFSKSDDTDTISSKTSKDDTHITKPPLPKSLPSLRPTSMVVKQSEPESAKSVGEEIKEEPLMKPIVESEKIQNESVMKEEGTCGEPCKIPLAPPAMDSGEKEGTSSEPPKRPLAPPVRDAAEKPGTPVEKESLKKRQIARPPPPTPKQKEDTAAQCDTPEKSKPEIHSKIQPSRPTKEPTQSTNSTPTHKEEKKPLPSRPTAPRAMDPPPDLPTRPGPGHPLYHYMLSTPHGLALHDFQGSHPDELSIQSNDVVIILKRIDDSWLMGQISNRQGIFPQDFIQIQVPLPGESLPPSQETFDTSQETFGTSGSVGDFISSDFVEEKVDTIGVGPRCCARFDFEGGGEGDLQFEEGDFIKIIDRVDEEWLKGEFNSRIGIFPVSFVEIIEDLPRGQELMSQQTENDGINQTVSSSQDSVTESEHCDTLQNFQQSEFSAMALHDYSGAPGELSLKFGDYINVLSKVSADWLCGELNGQMGKFPVHVIDEVPKGLPDFNDSSPSPVPLQNTKTLTCTALYDYNSGEPSDLIFSEGDIIEIIEKIGGDWMKGRLDGQEGIFPTAFVREHTDQESHQVPPVKDEEPLSVITGTALYDFQGQSDGELSFKTGDIIILGNFVTGAEEWRMGEIAGQHGMFPASFVA